MSKAPKLRITVLLSASDLWRLSRRGLTVVAIEETTEGGWTRRVPEAAKADLRARYRAMPKTAWFRDAHEGGSL